MVPIRGVYEIAIRVRDLARAEAFYRDVLGLEVGLRDEGRRWVFLRAGGQAGMIVLQEDKGDWPLQHFAFTVDRSEIERAAAELRGRGSTYGASCSKSGCPRAPSTSRIPTVYSLELCAPGGRATIPMSAARDF